ncbi:MAG: NAD(P)/FAD-dependent oxidoreductase [Nitrososphaerales archaeon]
MQKIVIIGAGILGLSIAYWLCRLYDLAVVIVEREHTVAYHASSRNTGVVHRPFYLDPTKKRLFVRSALKSYGFWKEFAKEKQLPWREVGTLEVATSERDIPILEQYVTWSKINELADGEVELLDGNAVNRLEPSVQCLSAIYCKTDAVVDFGQFCNALKDDVQAHGVQFMMETEVKRIERKGKRVQLALADKSLLEADLLINCAGGSSLDIAKKMGLAKHYAALHFRGDYWKIEPSFGKKITHNIYSVPRKSKFPFLDPHLIIRPSGGREIGPNAVPVSGPDVYHGIARNIAGFVAKTFESPVGNKARLLVNPEVLDLIYHEWRSSLSKGGMSKRVEKFIPSLNSDLLAGRGAAGIRTSLIGKDGFVPEAEEVSDELSYHILNYNSPGATGAPAFSAHIVRQLVRSDLLKPPTKRVKEFDDIEV